MIIKTSVRDNVSSKSIIEKAGLCTLNEIVASQAALTVWKSKKEWEKFADREKLQAQNFLKAAEDAGVKRIIYIGCALYTLPALLSDVCRLQSSGCGLRFAGSGSRPSKTANTKILRYASSKITVMLLVRRFINLI